MERDAYEREIELYKSKIDDLKSIIETRDTTFKGLPRSVMDSGSKGRDSTTDLKGSNYLNSVIESKDLEIKRLS